ncbi:hypothetical protein ZONE111905_10505 [Zobellia nedashkovskayae]
MEKYRVEKTSTKCPLLFVIFILEDNREGFLANKDFAGLEN